MKSISGREHLFFKMDLKIRTKLAGNLMAVSIIVIILYNCELFSSESVGASLFYKYQRGTQPIIRLEPLK